MTDSDDIWYCKQSIIHSSHIEVWVNKKSQLHRVDGPAIYSKFVGVQHWYVNNKKINSWEELQKETSISNEELLLIVLKWGQIQQNNKHQET